MRQLADIDFNQNGESLKKFITMTLDGISQSLSHGGRRYRVSSEIKFSIDVIQEKDSEGEK